MSTRKKPEWPEVRIDDEGVNLVLTRHARIYVSVRADCLTDSDDEGFAKAGWKEINLDFRGNLVRMAEFINRLTKIYNGMVDRINEQTEQSVPLKTIKKLRSVKTDAA